MAMKSVPCYEMNHSSLFSSFVYVPSQIHTRVRASKLKICAAPCVKASAASQRTPLLNLVVNRNPLAKISGRIVLVSFTLSAECPFPFYT